MELYAISQVYYRVKNGEIALIYLKQKLYSLYKIYDNNIDGYELSLKNVDHKSSEYGKTHKLFLPYNSNIHVINYKKIR